MRLTAIIALSLVMAACRSGIDLQVSIDRRDDLSLQSGSGPERCNAIQTEMTPPFEQSWSESLSGGTGNTTPLCAGSIAFIPTQINGVDVYDIQTGKEVGWITLPGAVLGTPAIADDVVYVPLSGGSASMAAVHISDGGIAWMYSGESVETPVLLIDTVVITAGVYGTIRCGSRRDSTTLWTRKLPKPIFAAPAGAGNTIFAACTNGDLYALARSDGRELWRVSTGSAIHAAPAASNGSVFAVNRNGRLFAIDIASGRVQWTVEVGAPVYAAPAIRNGYLLLAVSDGSLKAYKTMDGTLSWDYKLGSIPAGSPVIAGTTVAIAAMKGRVELLELSTGRLVWSADTFLRLRTSPLIFPGGLCLLSDDGEIIGFKAAP